MLINRIKTNNDTHTTNQNKRAALFQSLVAVTVLGAGVFVAWHFWPVILIHSLKWQKETTDYISELFYEHTVSAYLTILATCLLYGMLHSLGPGHGKVVVSTYLATHKTKVKTGIYITIVSALMQGIVAIVLVSSFVFLWHQTMRQLNGTVSEFVKFSGIVVLVLGVYLFAMVFKAIFRPSSSHEHHSHEHHEHGCSCGHKHSAHADELNNASQWREYLWIVLSIGIRPCSGAILVLFFSHLAHQFWLGVLGSIVMSLGTALTTSSIALLTVSGRKIVQHYSDIDVKYAQRMMLILKSTAGFILILLGVILIEMPGYGMSPIF